MLKRSKSPPGWNRQRRITGAKEHNGWNLKTSCDMHETGIVDQHGMTFLDGKTKFWQLQLAGGVNNRILDLWRQ
jgi:hypothetical protein